ncbi:MAG: hypothetical protein PHE51_09815, partial [Eubacteriales bacterium]|nr:hypothetical protein [Eubacteriales bacterium]
LQMTHHKDSKTVTSSISLRNPIDLTVDADYYITFDATLPAMSNVANSTFRLANSANIGSAPQLSAGITSNNANPPHGPYISNSGAKGVSSNIYYASTTREYGFGEWQSILLHFSVRNSTAGKIGTFQMRTFLDTDEETPTFTPSFWDQSRNMSIANLSASSPTTFDKLVLTGSHNAGSTLSAYFDNINIYKSAPINNYKATTLADPTLISGHAIVGQDISFDAPAATNLLGQAISVNTAGTGWYDCSTNPPTKLTDSYTYTIPSDMYGKKIKAVLATEAGGVQTTYEPFIGYVRLPYDYTRALNGAPSAASGFDNKNYNLWSNWEIGNIDRLIFHAYVNTNVSNTQSLGMNGSTGLILIQYEDDGTLKSVTTLPHRSFDTYTGAQSAGRLSIVFPVKTWEDRENHPEIWTWNVEQGDYFKLFIWNSNTSSFTHGAQKPVLPSPSVSPSLVPLDVQYTVPTT